VLGVTEDRGGDQTAAPGGGDRIKVQRQAARGLEEDGEGGHRLEGTAPPKFEEEAERGPGWTMCEPPSAASCTQESVRRIALEGRIGPDPVWQPQVSWGRPVERSLEWSFGRSCGYRPPRSGSAQ
jgi:hypothetical protein